MNRNHSFLLWASAGLLLMLGGCGYVGEPLPPSLGIPLPVKDLEVRERNGRITVEFTLPSYTTDGVPLAAFSDIELRAGPQVEPFELERWVAGALRIPVEAVEFGSMEADVPSDPWIGQQIVFGVRVSGNKGRFSDWSNLVVMQVASPLKAPDGLHAEGTAEGVRLTWKSEQRESRPAYRVFRSASGNLRRELLGITENTEYLDSRAQYETTYTYSVQAFLKLGDAESESDDSRPVAITPVDRFAPAVPSGLTVAAGLNSIELIWDSSAEPDFHTYRIYRSSGGGDFQPLNFSNAPAYSDRDIESGKTYNYCVTAIDASGNESARSGTVEVTAP